ncbi:hypothetical protein LTR62_005663 [Meristemomyces frigidus]|uniref:Uncharacterized protein n=1 Tax=Meristemomyces frigidus TaxID=1508187 RepID=A0AAN7TE84_9PEZI|nr:hypothetical protein LTR62_005663 [Meristemomyces frigidus]
MSWLSPKRRKTTSNLQTRANGNGPAGNGGGDNSDTPASPTTPRAERLPASPTPKPFSLPVLTRSDVPAQMESEGTLFYAYARRKAGHMLIIVSRVQGNDLQSRYLLTFAGTDVADEWWNLLQTNFSDTSRPGPQLFSFVDPPDLLAKTWKHPAFEHLKSKWMYISFSDTPEGGLGGATQGIIPVRDAEGHMLSGTGLAPSGPELAGSMREANKEAKTVRDDLSRLEGYFERMMEAMEKNTKQIAALAERREGSNLGQHEEREREGYFGSPDISSHLDRVNELLERHSEHMETLAKQQSENERKLSSNLQDLAGKQKNDCLDISQLSAHLDRIQSLMEKGSSRHEESARSALEQQARPTQIDFTPLTERLERVQEAVEQNSALVRTLLEEGTAPDSKPGTPFWGKDFGQSPAPTMDLSPLTEHLQKIHQAIEQQSSHMQALVGFATGSEGGELGPESPGLIRSAGDATGGATGKSLAPLGEHLEQIYTAIEEGNAFARSTGRISLEPLVEKMEATRLAIEANKTAVVNMAPLTERLDGLSKQLTELVHGSATASERFEVLLQHHAKFENSMIDPPAIDFAPVTERLGEVNAHLEVLREWAEFDSEQLKELVDSQKAVPDEDEDVGEGEEGEEGEGEEEDNGPDPQQVLVEHLQGIRVATEKNSEHIRALAESYHRARHTPPPRAEIDITPLTERLNKIHTVLESQAVERSRATSPGVGDAKFVLSALASHLSRIQAITESNAQAVVAFRDAQGKGQESWQKAVASTAETLALLARQQAQRDALLTRQRAEQSQLLERARNSDQRIDTLGGHVSDLMTSQKNVVDVVRELAKSLAAQSQVKPGQDVLPPPRKVGRKIVGYVYDGPRDEVDSPRGSRTGSISGIGGVER